MATLAGSPASTPFCESLRDRPRRHLRRASPARKTGGGGCRLEAPRCRMERKKCFQALEATSKTGAHAKTCNEYSLLGLGKNWKRNHVLQSTVHDQQYLPGIELGTTSGGDTSPFLYKPYMDHLWKTLVKRTPDFQSLFLEPDFMRQVGKSGAKTSKVFNWLNSASRLRRIRLTYFDGGSAIQAFNSILYPDFRFDVPLLGIDLLSFGASKILCAIDFTPLSQDSVYLDKYTSQLAPVHAKIAGHCGRMTTKFYDENQFFSKQLIFYRSDLGPKDPILEVPHGLFFTTYVNYIDTYLEILQAAEPNGDPQRMSYVASRQNAYNRHAEERDPAIKIFNKHFGEEWSERFTREFLFQQTPFDEKMIQVRT